MKDFGKFKKLLGDRRIRSVIIALGLTGILLIFLSGFIGSESSQPSDTQPIEQYRNNLQTSLTNMLESIDGVGKTSVLLTIENSAEGVYLENSSTKTKEIEPQIRGVVIACEGGDEPVTVERVNDAVTKALGISSAKVCVTKLSDG